MVAIIKVGRSWYVVQVYSQTDYQILDGPYSGAAQAQGSPVWEKLTDSLSPLGR